MGPGPFRIANNHLEAAGENVMFGGADPLIADLVPADIEIVGNHFAKPLRWKEDDSRYEGVAWSVKNLFELKNARRVLVEGNVLEYNWPHAQNGFAILFTVRNQDGRAPWSVVEDVTFRDNMVRHVGGGINILGHDDIHPSRRTSRIAIVDNVFADVGGSWGHGRLFQLLDGTDAVRDRPQHRLSYRHAAVRRRRAPAHRLRLPQQHRAGRARPVSPALAPRQDSPPSTDIFRQPSFAATFSSAAIPSSFLRIISFPERSTRLAGRPPRTVKGLRSWLRAIPPPAPMDGTRVPQPRSSRRLRRREPRSIWRRRRSR